jgi:cytoskeletal protein CcmA (bactofilin family)
VWRKQESSHPHPAPEPVSAPPVEPRPLRSIPEVTPAPADDRSARLPAAPSGSITKTIQIHGEISGSEDLYVDGEVQGRICITGGKVTVGPNGRVNSDIEANEILVYGEVQGLLRGAERVYLGRTAKAAGDIATRRIGIEEGARFTGRVQVIETQEPRIVRVSDNGANEEAAPSLASHAQKLDS